MFSDILSNQHAKPRRRTGARQQPDRYPETEEAAYIKAWSYDEGKKQGTTRCVK